MTKNKVKSMKKTKAKPHKDLYHFSQLLKLTERTITNDGTDIDQFFKDQAERLRKQVEALK